MGKRTIKTVGKLVKKERFRSVENETFSDKLILENMEPYPGYHGTTVPDNLEADSLFVITKMNYNDERMIRAIQNVKKKFEHKFDGAPGTVRYQNKYYHFLRFKFLPYRLAGDLLRLFEDAGIEFRKYRKVAPYETIIEVRKFFLMEEESDGIFRDLDDSNIWYLQIPALLSWNNFEKITLGIKYNIEERNFDAAQTSVFCREGMLDFVRIFDMETSQSKLKYIRDKYLEAIARL